MARTVQVVGWSGLGYYKTPNSTTIHSIGMVNYLIMAMIIIGEYLLFTWSAICGESLELTLELIRRLHNYVFKYCKGSSFEKKESNYTRTVR